jgi:tetratricopeptide (TPR) repeat protein
MIINDEQEAIQLISASAKSGDFEDAIVQLKNLLAAHPEHEFAHGMLAAIYAELEMADRAIEQFRRVLAINPANTLARVQLGALQLAAKRPDDLLETWKPCLDEPDNYIGRYYSGLALLQLEKPGEARAMLEQAVQRMPAEHALRRQVQQLIEQLSG